MTKKLILIFAMIFILAGCEISQREFWVSPHPCDDVPQENRWYHQGCD